MSFLFDKQTDITPPDLLGLRQKLTGGLGNQYSDLLAGGPNSAGFMSQVLDPLRRAYSTNLKTSLTQAKESAGNLTGSGFANTLGTSVRRSLADEDQLEAGYTSRERDRALSFLSAFGTYGGQPANQPGFLSYLFRGATAAAPLLAKL